MTAAAKKTVPAPKWLEPADDSETAADAETEEAKDEWAEYTADPDTQWIEYREPITSQVDIPGQGPTTVQDYKVHRVPIKEWPAYERTLNESKKGL